ncbi:MAG: TRAP transporter small permease subunit [Actinomyces sp.]|nr:MAG: TRAP transporter small permease subunit [Actinomyces sp.]
MSQDPPPASGATDTDTTGAGDDAPLEPPRNALERALVRLVRGIEHVSDAAGAVSALLVLVVFVVGIVNVALRYLGRWTEQSLTNNTWIESQWYLFGAIFLLGFPWVLKEQINPRVDFWYAGYSARRKAWIDFVGHLIFLVPFCFVALRILWDPILTSFGRRPDGSFPTWKVWEIWEQSPDAGGLPRAPIKGAIYVGFVLLGLQAVAEVIKAGFVVVGRDHLVPRKERVAPLRIE